MVVPTVAAITLLGGFLRFYNLGRESLWLDEGTSIWIAHLNWHSLWKLLSTSEANMAPYYLLLHFWILCGDSEAIARSLSALAGTATIAVVFLLGQRMFNARAALIASFLLALNTFHIRYSQEARGYSLAALLTAVSCLFLVRAIQRESRFDWLCYVLVSALSVYAHFFAALVIAAQWISFVALPPRSIRWRQLALCVGAVALLCTPLAVYVLFVDHATHLDWIPRPSLQALYSLFDEFAGPDKRLLIAFYGLTSLAGMIWGLREWRRPKDALGRWHFVLVTSWFFFPILLTFVVSQWSPLFVDRFLLVSLPALALLAAFGLSRVCPGVEAVLLLAIVLLWQCRVLKTYESVQVKEDWRGSSAYILSQETPADALVFYEPGCQREFAYYARREGRTAEIGTILEANFQAPRQDGPLPTDLPRRFPRVWLIQTHLFKQELQDKGAAIRAFLARQYRSATKESFRGVEVYLYSAGPERSVHP